MKHGINKKNTTCLDQEKEMDRARISIRKRGCEIKCFIGVPDLLFSAQGNTLGYIAHEGRLNAEGLRSHHN
jgi:hypothetical protein